MLELHIISFSTFYFGKIILNRFNYMMLTINEIRKKTVAVGTDAKSAARWVRSGGEKRAYGDCVASKIEII